ncbi:ATP-dependent RNA helicase SUV3 homolog, mitochondrial-like [Mercenaria mercenaria]|uniref:ATP-dependent RNA helicase SUV3 homolog, mitochondrial-like n=1 Tax=Mercenaria mercenaria TaxID=6596 RepID=UPI00234E854D|nr:ATP-dependent RNA helicase SUV3 homolog, mitochondrial-like [Mercenaria mercenaria]
MLRNSFRDLRVRIPTKVLRSNGMIDCLCSLNTIRISSYSSKRKDRSPQGRKVKGRVVQKAPKLKRGPKLPKVTSQKDVPSEPDQLFKPVYPDPVKKSSDTQDIGEEIAGKLTKAEKAKVLRQFIIDQSTQMLAAQHGLEGTVYETALQSFRKYCIGSSQLPVELHIVFKDLVQDVGHVSDLFPFFLNHSKIVYPHLDCMEDLQKISDLTDPSRWYPLARTMQRKIIYHSGPTNSGKTYHALKRFMESESGVYCGPLRLLAMEVFDKCNNADVPCDLITGETRRFANEDETPAEHVACTVEMANLSQEYEVAVIDEIQMIGDLQRGWSWTRSLLGIAAKEVHVCGEETAIDLVENLMYSTGDSFEVRKYERLTSLTYLEEAVGNFDNLKKGDCIVCFSKKDIFKVFNILVAKGHKCAVIYGDLPPGTKIMQSRKFNDPNDPCSVLVATDAVGMGLNLAIKRVVFYSLIKRTLREDHTLSMDYLSTSQAQQIGGRAGRFRTQFEDGEVTTFWPKDLGHLHNIVNVEKSPLKKAGMNPTAEMIEMFSYHLPKASLSNLIDIFVHVCKLDDMYFMCNLMQFKELSELIEDIPLPLRTRYTLCSSPLKVRKGFAQVAFVKIAAQMSKGFPLTYDWLCQKLGAPFNIPRSVSELEQLEGAFDVVDIYLWLSYRYPDLFVDADEVRQLRLKLDAIIQSFLNRGRLSEKKRRKLDLSTVMNDQQAAGTGLEKLEPDLIQNNPLQAYTPKPKPKKDSEKYKVLTDVFKELEDVERGIVEPEDKAIKSLFSNVEDSSNESVNVEKDIGKHEEKIVNDGATDIEKHEEKIVIAAAATDIEKHEEKNVMIDTATDKSAFLKKEGFLSKNNEMYNEIAGSYKIEAMFQKKDKESTKSGQAHSDESQSANMSDSGEINKQEVTKFGMDIEEINEFKDMFTSNQNKKVRTPERSGMGEEDLNKLKDMLTSMKKLTGKRKKKPSKANDKNEEELVTKFVHVYPRKQIKKMNYDFQMSENEGLHDTGNSDKISNFSERFSILSNKNRPQNVQERNSDLNTELYKESHGEKHDKSSSMKNKSLAASRANKLNKSSSPKVNGTGNVEQAENNFEDRTFEPEKETPSLTHTFFVEGEESLSDKSLNGKTEISTERGEGSLEEKLVEEGVLTAEMLEKLKAEWEKKQIKGQKNENDGNKNSIER